MTMGVADGSAVIEKPAWALAKPDTLRNTGKREQQGCPQGFMRGNSQGEMFAPQLSRCAQQPTQAMTLCAFGIGDDAIDCRVMLQQGLRLGSGKNGERLRHKTSAQFRNQRGG
jgi:hypothetical protein